MSKFIIECNEDNFNKQVLGEALPVLVDFWAPWCGPCNMITPIVEAVAKDYEGKLKVVKVNIQDNETIGATYKLRSIPALFLFKDGEIIGKKIGTVTQEELETFLNQNIPYFQ